jgi:CheY-like chemotaxis protein
MKKRILFIEDDEFLNRTYSKVFSLSGYEAVTATDGEMALEMLEKAETLPDVVALDVNIPKMNGREFLKNIKQNDKLKNIPIVILTNSFYREDEGEFLDLGAVAFLRKIETDNKSLVKQIDDIILKFKNVV